MTDHPRNPHRRDIYLGWLLPGLEVDIKVINMSLAELERVNPTRVMKIKEIL